MDEIADIKRLAGIKEEEYPHLNIHAESSAADLARTFINGNISDAFNAVQGNLPLFAEVALILNNVGHDELLGFLQMAMKRG